ncbi:MAG TPA: DUF533 domain-containing protein [Acidobacteriota bacterium]|nr:DUF533 domain-containing protein [Acidobacteriota bacterium]
MIDGERLLGGLLKQGLRGTRGRRRSGLDSLFGSTTNTMLGMGALGIAIAAFEHFTKGPSSSSSQTAAPPSRSPGRTPPPPPPPPGTLEVSETAPVPPSVPGATFGNQADTGEPVLLIRAMIAAANADGKIDGSEMGAIINYLEQAGMTGEERDFIEKELASPKSIDSILPQVQGEELANQIYAVSLLAIEVDTKAERDYLRYLQARLGISDQTARELHGQFEPSAEDGDSGDSAESK